MVPRLNRRESEVFLAFCQSARQAMVPFMGHNSCIAATRVTIDTLRRFSIDCQPMSVKFALEVPSRRIAYTSGCSDAELSTAKGAVGCPWGEGWRGHLVARYKDALIDSSLDQADVALKGIIGLQPEVYVFPFDQEQNGVELTISTQKQERCKLTYIKTEDRSYETSDAWNDEGLELLTDLTFKAVDRRLRKIQRNEL